MIAAAAPKQLALRIRQLGLGLLTSGALSMAVAGDQAPTRAQDPAWGEVLYEYHQGRALAALTRLAVADAKGGIDGHGVYPSLVEGGLMLSWGLSREARNRFLALLDDTVAVAPRNQAWFYLAKVFYLEGDSDAARDALGRLQLDSFRETSPDLYREARFLAGQIAVQRGGEPDAATVDQVLADLPANSLFSAYLRYNQALASADTPNQTVLAGLLDDLAGLDWLDANDGERLALLDRVRLTLASDRYQSGEHAQVPGLLAPIRDDSLFAPAARRLVTLSADGAQAEQALADLPAEAPGPGAAMVRGVLQERAGRTDLALVSYGQAADFWQQQYDRIGRRLQAPDQADLLASIRFVTRERGKVRHLPGTALLDFPEAMVTDPYGRLAVMPAEDSPGLAALVADEGFQRALKTFHELNQMAALLATGDRKLASFDLMIETRRQQRAERIRDTREALNGIEDEQWFQRQRELHRQVRQAEANNDAGFFRNGEQLALYQRLQQARQRLAALPEGEADEQKRRLARVAAALQWQVANDYGVNRWQVRDQLNRLDDALAELTGRKRRLEDEMAAPVTAAGLDRRVADSRRRLRSLTRAVAEARTQARDQLLAQLRDHYQQDRQQAHRYLLASRLAETRLLDQRFREQRAGADASPQQLAETLDQLIVRYRELAALLDDAEAIYASERRLTDLMFIKAEQQYVDAAVDTFEPVLDGYRALLAGYPDHTSNHRIRYQIARIHGLRGDREAQRQALEELIARHPDSPLWLEAQFRRAELLFTDGDYAAAGEGYRAVIQATGPDQQQRAQTFATHALYMKGWTEFRQGDYQAALLSYGQVLDRLLPQDATPGDLDRQHQTLVEDLFRVQGLSFSYLGGAPAVADLFRQLGNKPWEALVYERYADQLVGREQYSDAVAVYQQYIDEHPFREQAPHYAIRIMDIHRQGGFSEAIAPAQADFVNRYGVHSDYWQQAPDTVRGAIRDQLLVLLPELANRHYLKARDADAESVRNRQYDLAASYYRGFADTFPDHPRTPEMLFLLAETRQARGQWPEAIAIFERVAYDHGSHERAAEAGYAAILGYQQSGLAAVADSPWPEREQQSRIRFSERFPRDSRAEAVLYTAIRYESRAGRHQPLRELSDRLLSWRPLQDPDLIAETRLLLARSYYDTAEYALAEQAYGQALAELPEQDPRRSDITDSLAASIYRLGEGLLAAGEQQAAVTEWLRLATVAPGTELAIRARYDAAGLLLDMADYQDALTVMTDLRAAHPDHELTGRLPARMALAYRETGQWSLAAAELEALAESSDDPVQQRENRWLAAELYDRSGDLARATDAYRRYANTWPEPVSPYMEAANRLAELYQQQQDGERRRYWLRKQIETADRLGDRADGRTVQLASAASLTLADQARDSFEGIALTLPLQDNLRAKMLALEEAAEGYERTAGYGHEDFTSQAGYRLAELYRTLAGDLIESERPDGLSDMELMQYELLLEEQAFPFEDDAIAIHEQNVRQTREGHYDEWVKRSFEALGTLLPARYRKPEQSGGAVDELR